MARTNTGAVDSNKLSRHNDDPRAYPFPFGEFVGERLDTVPSNLRQWATQAHLARNSWYPAYIKANQRYEELLLQTPEAYPFPFGEHEDKRLDEVPEDLILWSIHPSRSGNAWYQNLEKASRLYLDKLYDQESPGSVTIWFGVQYKGHRLDDVYYKRPDFINFCLKPEHNKCPWYHKFKDLVQSYEIHLQTHQQPYRPRTPAHVENPTGKLLGRCDDGSDAEPAAVDEPETNDLHQLTQSFSALSLSQKSAGSPNNDDELPRAPRKSARLHGKSARRESGNDDSGIPEYDTHTNTPSRLGRSYRTQSDVEK